MRVIASGNLTVDLIRAQRFDIACRDHGDQHISRCEPCKDNKQDTDHPQIDRVELSPQALASDPWALDAKRVSEVMATSKMTGQESPQPDPGVDPEQLSPVVGSPALSGLGAAWIVPGTLLDVVA